MDHYGAHAKHVGNCARRLTACRTKAAQCIAGNIIAARDRNLADRVGHILDGNGEEIFGKVLGTLIAQCVCRKRGKSDAHGIGVDRLSARWAEYCWKQRGLDAP